MDVKIPITVQTEFGICGPLILELKCFLNSKMYNDFILLSRFRIDSQILRTFCR